MKEEGIKENTVSLKKWSLWNSVPHHTQW
jgi:hypothetical protein